MFIVKSEINFSEDSWLHVAFFVLATILLISLIGVFALQRESDAKEVAEEDLDKPVMTLIPQEKDDRFVHPRIAGLEDWTRPEGPLHVAMQIGHLEAENAPDELTAIRRNTGAQVGSITEVSITSEIAELVKSDLESDEIRVTILPTTIPPNFYSDVFLSLHADGSLDPSVSGYKIASSWYDYTGKGRELVADLEESYERATGLIRDPNISRNMRGYYGFNWRRYEHSAHPMAVSAIVEIGFVTNYSDRLFLTQSPEIAAKGIADGVRKFLDVDIL